MAQASSGTSSSDGNIIAIDNAVNDDGQAKKKRIRIDPPYPDQKRREWPDTQHLVEVTLMERDATLSNDRKTLIFSPRLHADVLISLRPWPNYTHVALMQ